MSGIEVAGLVLAVIPLMLEGLKAYPKTKFYQTTQAFMRAKRERRDFVRQLLLLHTELRFAMIDVFKRINCSLTADQRRALTAADSVGETFFNVWKDISTANRDILESAFQQTIDHVGTVLDDMAEMLSEMMKHTEISCDSGMESLKAFIKRHSEDKTFSVTKNLSGRFKFAKADSRRRELIEQMGKHIKLLEKLNKGQEQITQFVTAGNLIESERGFDPFLEKVRMYSARLYQSLSDIWQCGCHKSPSAMLRLERRGTHEKEAYELRFSIILTFEFASTSEQTVWAFQETEIYVDQR